MIDKPKYHYRCEKCGFDLEFLMPWDEIDIDHHLDRWGDFVISVGKWHVKWGCSHKLDDLTESQARRG